MTKKVLLIVALVVVIPLVGWLDVWLAFQFGAWVDVTLGTGLEGGGMLGMFAFVVLAATQIGALVWASAQS